MTINQGASTNAFFPAIASKQHMKKKLWTHCSLYLNFTCGVVHNLRLGVWHDNNQRQGDFYILVVIRAMRARATTGKGARLPVPLMKTEVCLVRWVSRKMVLFRCKTILIPSVLDQFQIDFFQWQIINKTHEMRKTNFFEWMFWILFIIVSPDNWIQY